MRFREVMQALRPEGDGWVGLVTDDWLQGRSAFGGLQVSMAVRAMRALVPVALPLRTLQVTFLAPVGSGKVRIQAKLLREGKNTLQVEARLLEGEQTLCLVIGIFGATRASSIAIRPAQPAVADNGSPALPFLKGITPDFTQHFSMRWLKGGLPYSGSSEAGGVIEVGLRDEGMADELALPTIADAIPPLALALLRKPAPVSSMTWMLELLADHYDQQPLLGWRVDADVTAAADGYTSQTAMIWAPDGSPAMLSRQSMVVFG